MTLTERLAKVRLLALDFDGVLTTNKVWTFADGSEAVECSRADGIGLDRLKALDVMIIVITSEPPFTAGHRSICDVRCAKLGIAVLHADKASKFQLLQDYTNHPRWLPLDDVAYVGNDVNDLECLQAVGMPIAVADAAIALHLQQSKFEWTVRNGGDGAVREVCDAIADAIEQHKPNLQRVAEALG